jgi:hypothetical protein
MNPEKTEFWLFLTDVNQQAVKNFARAFEPKHHHLNLELNPVDKKDAFFKPKENVVWDDLNKLPQWQLVLLTVEDVAYEAYCLCLNQGWNACLFDPI